MRRRFSSDGMVLWVVVSAAALLTSGCPSEDRSAEGAPAAERQSTQRDGPTGPQASGESRQVRFETEDGVTIVGSLRPGGSATAPAAILVHQLGSNRSEWNGVVRQLSEAPGLTTLAIDLRGHGDSTTGPDGETVDWRQLEREDWGEIGQDVLAAVAFLDEQQDLQPERIVAAGASIGSSAVAVAAAQDERIDAVALLSPGRAYRGVDAIRPVARISQRPTLIAAAEQDEHSAETANDMARIAKAGHKLMIGGSAHGVKMLDQDPELAERLVGFLREPARADDESG